MSSYEYHQILQFLYFEGYADSYESAEYLFEQLSDEEFEELNEARRKLAHSFPLKPSEKRSAANIGRMNDGDFSVPPGGSVRVRSSRKVKPEPEAEPTPTTPTTSKPKRKSEFIDRSGASDQGTRGPRRRIREDREDFNIITEFLFDEGYADTIESAELIAESISKQWANQILDEAHLILEKPYQIYGPDPHGPSDSESRPLGKPYRNKKRANKRADILDQEIGGYRHSVRKVDEEYKDLTPEKEEKVKNRVGELARDIQVQGERMKDLKKKPFGKYRPKVKQEKEAILKSARKKQKLVQNASDALIRTSTSRSASIQKRIQDLKDRS